MLEEEYEDADRLELYDDNCNSRRCPPRCRCNKCIPVYKCPRDCKCDRCLPRCRPGCRCNKCIPVYKCPPGCRCRRCYSSRCPPDCNCYQCRVPAPVARIECSSDLFTSIIEPLSNVKTFKPYFDNSNTVEFMFRRVQATVTLQWETFTGTLTSTVAYLTIRQSFGNLPPDGITAVIAVEYNTEKGLGLFVIDRTSATDVARIYLRTDRSTTGISPNTTLTIPGAAVTWITGYKKVY